VSEGGLQPASVGCNPVHLIVYKVEPPPTFLPDPYLQSWQF